MKTKNIYQGIALLAVALTTAACQNELNEDATQPQPGQKVNMTIRATQGITPQTRISYDDQLGVADIDEIVVTWEPTETIKVFGYTTTELDYSEEFTSVANSLSEDKKSISFGGKIEQRDRYLAMYPVSNCKHEEGAILTSFLNQTQNCYTPMAHLKDFDFMVGEPEAPAEGSTEAPAAGSTEAPAAGKYDKFIFTHKATMIRFILNLPSEVITKVSLSFTTNTLYPGIFTTVDADGVTTGMDDMIPSVPSLDLAIINHTASTEPLKAYMMIPPFDASSDVLKITVNTKSGSIYESSINAASSQPLEAGLCYTITPELAVTPEINIPVEEGQLGDALAEFTPDATQTELALTGAVGTEDIAALATFLKDSKAENIATLDLSGLNFPNTGTDSDGDPIITVTGFTGCTTLTDVKLPVEATYIGDDAFSGCTALTTISQDEPAANSRASISTRLKAVGARAFKDTDIDVMFLHKNVTGIGDNAFENCSALKAIVFEGTLVVKTLGVDVVKGANEELKVLLPNITDATLAGTYNKALNRPTLYKYNGTYSTASATDKADPTKYEKTFTDGSSLDDFEFGGSFEL